MAPRTVTGAYTRDKGSPGAERLTLEGQAVQAMRSPTWPAPATRDYKGSSESSLIRKDGKVRSDMLDYAAEQFWRAPGPASENSLRGSGQDPALRKAQGHQVNLHDQAAFFHPPSSPDQPIAAGSMSSTAGPNSNQPSVRRKLNPIFVEALIRWPTGLSGFARPETALTRWLQQQRSYLSALASGYSAKADQMDLFA
jgi:hypothetical protein